MSKHYGLPYMGSKNKIAEHIVYGWQTRENDYQVRTPYVEDDSEMFTTINEVPF